MHTAARLDGDPLGFVRNRAPTFRHLKLQPVNVQTIFRSITNIHRDQKFLYHRPITAGDRLYFDTYLDSVIESHGTVIAEIRSEVTDADGNPIITSIVTMLGESSNPDANAEATIAAIASIRAGA